MTVERRRADDLDGDPAGARCESGRAGTSRRMRTMTVGGAAPAAGDDRGVRRAPRPPHHPRLGHDRDVPDRDDLRRARPGARALGRRRVRQARPAGAADPVRRDPRSRRGGARAVGRREHGRARGARAVDQLVVLRGARGGRPLDGRRLVQDGRHRHDRARRLRRGAGSRQGPRQVGRRVDLDRRARERADGPPGRRGGRGDRRPRREVVGAAARRRRAARGRDRERRRAPRVPRAELRQVLAPRPVRVRRGDPEDRGRQVPQDCAPRAVRDDERARRPGGDGNVHLAPSGATRSRSSRSTTRR